MKGWVVVKKKYHPITEDKTILRLQEQRNKNFHASERKGDILKQIQRKLVQVEKLAVIYHKHNESIGKMQFQFNDIQRTITKCRTNQLQLSDQEVVLIPNQELK